jgi:hypothetical protein
MHLQIPTVFRESIYQPHPHPPLYLYTLHTPQLNQIFDLEIKCLFETYMFGNNCLVLDQ